ncbi:metal-sulfur cluster assembly factor [Bacillus sp. FJAT-29790]|uniref:metal-sulfur cluster assembly factor n=1 Tax=Bacillus sp. FJAT-29790 TaxID=1895002 RepID=UPI001C247939|nr:metal-sulfur cluster assembly factor [Bacillus sp. FJAT-29790]MBU8879043.1 metal-sulfur cluster assembly factor [Bacillus sp. FJAT-29790]
MLLKDKVIENLKRVMDPELNINVVDLGLIYDVEIPSEGTVYITMTLTTPGCPLHDSITSGVKYCILEMDEITTVEVNLVWEPAWTPEKMTAEGLKKLQS